MEVTVYGMHRESYEAVSRVAGSFVQFRRGVDLLLDRQIPFVVKAALLPPNRSEIDEFEAWAATIQRLTAPPRYPCSSICAVAGMTSRRTGSSSRYDCYPKKV